MPRMDESVMVAASPTTDDSHELLPVRINVLSPNPRIKTSNTITTSKYTVVTFLPYCLWELLHPKKR